MLRSFAKLNRAIYVPMQGPSEMGASGKLERWDRIADLPKMMVYRVSQWRNRRRPDIPEAILTKAPSAELRPDQKDQDSLPAYEVLDAILELYMENDESLEAIVQAGFDRADVERVTRLVKINEYKRRQAPVGIRVTHRSFGKDWRYPITSKFRA